MPTPTAAAPLDALRLYDPTKYRTIKDVPILDCHSPIKKRVRNPAAITPDNPDGLVEMMLKCDEDDLDTIARNANRAAEAGRPPVLQIGHTPLEQDVPESFHPKPVGLQSNHRVRMIDGKPWLCADMHLRLDRIDEASDYPQVSVERVNWGDDQAHTIRATAFLRRQPERDVPMIPYSADDPPLALLTCYSRDVPGPATGGPTRADVMAYATKHFLTDLGQARRRLLADKPALANYAKERSDLTVATAQAAPRSLSKGDSGFVAFAARHFLTDIGEARRKYDAARAKGEA
jgi:hypothetical protein